jgi:hypothetical protein
MGSDNNKQGASPNAPEEKAGIPTKVFKYLCKEECTFQGKFRRPGDIVVLSEKKGVPHFAFVE